MKRKKMLPFLAIFSCLLPLLLAHKVGKAATLSDLSSHSIINHLVGIQTEKDYRVGGSPLYFPTFLLHLYQMNEGKFLWSNSQSIDQLFTAIKKSGEEGLIPTEYHLQPLQDLRGMLAEGQSSPSRQADFDLLLTDAFIRLAYDKCLGKVDPNHLHGSWNLPKRSDDHNFLKAVAWAIFSDRVGEMLLGLSPQLPAYGRLKQALEYFRQIRERGGWPSLTPGPTLRLGMEGERVHILRRRLASCGDLSEENSDSSRFDEELEEAVIRFQKRNFLEADGLVGKKTLAVLNHTVDDRINQIRVNLERLRWLSHDMPQSCILIDIAGYTLTYRYEGKIIWTTRVVVGKPYHKTPTLAAAIKYLVINPTWNIPRSILKNEVLPEIQKDRNYLTEENLQVVTPDGHIISPWSIDWQAYTGRTFPYLLRQTPGPHNALGRVKFIFPNRYSVYLHDTPHRKLFEKERRAFSHGCIRVDKPLELAELILQNDGQKWDRERLEQVIAGRKIKYVNLHTPLPIMLLYWTVNVSADQAVSFRQDVYGRDEKVLQALDGIFQARDKISREGESIGQAVSNNLFRAEETGVSPENSSE